MPDCPSLGSRDERNGLQLFAGPRIGAWLPNETLFSLASRQHHVSGNWNPSETCQQLFGHPRCGSAHDLPSNIDALCTQVDGQLGSPKEIICQRTILPFYLPYRTRADAENSIASMRTSGIGGLKAQLGILASRFGGSHPLKACAACMAHDLAGFGVAYWHVDHQYPGIWLCPIHNEILRVANVKSTGVIRFGWILPSKCDLALPWHNQDDAYQPPSSVLAALRATATCSLATASLPAGFHFDPGRVAAIYRARIIESGVATVTGRIHHELLARSVLPLCQSLRAIREFTALPADEAQVGSQLVRMLSQARVSSHPLRHFVMILSLFESWEDFWTIYSTWRETPRGSSDDSAPGSDGADTRPEDGRRQHFLGLLATGTASVYRAAKACGVDTQTGIVWAAKAGIRIKRRPKTLSSDLFSRLTAALNRGEDKQKIATDLSVSVQAVTRVLQTEVGLSARWHEIRFTALQRRNRGAWTRFFDESPSASQQEFRDLAPAGFAWLYRNDRSWLRERVATLQTRIATNNATVNWDLRDGSLSTRVLDVGLEIRSKTGKRISVGQLCQQIHELKPRLSQLNSLPLTRRAISMVTRAPSRYLSPELF